MWMVVYFCVVCRSGWKNNALGVFDAMISIRQRKEYKPQKFQDYTAQEENDGLEDKLPSSM